MELFVKNLLQHVSISILVVSIISYNQQLFVVHENLIIAIVEECKFIVSSDIFVAMVNRLLEQLVPSILFLLLRNYFHSIEKVLRTKVSNELSTKFTIAFLLVLGPKISARQSTTLSRIFRRQARPPSLHSEQGIVE